MGLRETYQVVIDVTAEGARKSLKSLKKDVTEAEGAVGKMKAAWKGGTDFISQNAGAFAMMAGTAIVAFGVRSVKVFEDTAKAARDLGVTIGTTTESASRWIAIADDVGGSADDIAAGAKEIAKNLDASKWEEYGIKTRDAGGAARDTSDILVDALAAVSSIENEHDRATAGVELFSKGWKGLAPLVGHTADEYRNMLGAVEDGQVITDGESEKAKQMALAQDAVADAFHEVTLAAGGFVAGLAPALETLADMASGALGAAGALSDLFIGTKPVTKEMGALKAAAGGADESVAGLMNAFADLATATGDGRSNIDKTGQLIGQFAPGADASELSFRNLQDAFAAVAADSPDNAAKVVAGLRAILTAGDAGNEHAQDWIDTYGLTSDKVDDLEASLRAGASATDDAAAATDDATSYTQSYRDAQDEAAQAVEDRRKAEEDLYDELLGQVDAQYDYLNQARDTISQVKEYNEVLADQKSSEEDIIDVTEKTRQSMVDTATKYAESKGAVDGSKESIRLMIESLEAQRDTLVPGSPLRVALDAYIGLLNGIDKEVTTQLYLDIVERYQGHGVPMPNSSAAPRAGAAGKGAAGRNGLASDPIIEWYPQQVEQATQEVVRSEEEMWDLRFEMGEVGEAEYRAHQQERLATEKKYGDAYMDAWRKLHAFELADQRKADAEQAERDRQAKADEAERDRQAKADQAERDRAEKERKDAEREAEKEAIRAHDEWERNQFLHAAAQREMDEAAQAVDSANAEVIWNQADPNASPADRERALKNMAQALYRRADAGANLAGLDDGTVEWARAVRASLRADEANVPALAPYIDAILRGIPDLAAGGVARATPGGRIVRVAEAGRDEAIIPLDEDPRTSGGGGGEVHHHYHVLGSLDQAAARKIDRALTELRRGWR